MLPRTVLSLFLLITSAAAQTATVSKSEDPGIPHIVKRTQLVYVPVIVEDKHGKTLTGLTKDSFVIDQDGHAQTIAVFEEVRRAAAYEKAPAMGVGIVENFAVTDTQARKTVIIILDTLNTPFLQQGVAKKALIKFLETSLQPDQPVALMVLSKKGLHQVHSITADPKILVDSVKHVDSAYQPGIKNREPLQLDINNPDFVNTNPANRNAEVEAGMLMAYLDGVESHYVLRDAARTTLDAMEQLAGCFDGIPGRKSVIWATAGFPFNINDPQSFNGIDSSFYNDYERTWRRLNDANVALYPIDVAGLGSFGSTPLPTKPQQPFSTRRDSSFAIPYNMHSEQQSTMLMFARATGGKAFLNSNDITGAFKKASEEADSYYLLGYYLRSGEDHPGWHKLKVHVNASHGDMRSRDGFFIGNETDSKKDRLKELTLALSAPADYTGVHFGISMPDLASGSVKPVAAQPIAEKRVEKIHVSFPPGALSIDPDRGNLVAADFAVVAIVKDKVIGQTISSVQFKLTPAQLQEATHKGYGFDDSFTVPPGDYEVRVVVRDLYNSKLGTVRTRLIVP